MTFPADILNVVEIKLKYKHEAEKTTLKLDVEENGVSCKLC